MLKTKKNIVSIGSTVDSYLTADSVGKYHFSRIIFKRELLLAYESWLSNCDEMGFDFTFAYIPDKNYDTLIGFSNFEVSAINGSKVIFQEVSKNEENYTEKVRKLFDEEMNNSAYLITSDGSKTNAFIRKRFFGQNYSEIMKPLDFFEKNSKSLHTEGEEQKI